MTDEKGPTTKTLPGPLRWSLAIGLVLIVLLVVTGIEVKRAEPILHKALLDTLSAKFKTKVELDEFHVSLLRGLQVSGKGLRIFGQGDPNPSEPGVQPVIAVQQFDFRMSVLAFLRSPIRVDTVHLNGLVINIPPKEQRGEIGQVGANVKKIRIVVDRFVCDQAKLIVNTLTPGKPPRIFDIEKLNMKTIAQGAPLDFDASLTNPVPVGHIFSSGEFGPWQPENPREIPIRGTYTFEHANLGTIKGIGGILSSTGKYSGVLDKIIVDGTTETPDFEVKRSGQKVPLHTEFHAIVDGTSGDTYLEPVKARINADTWLTAEGSVVRNPEPKGHRVELNVTIGKGRIEDLLRLGVHTSPPVLVGVVRLKTKFDLPPGAPDIADRLRLAGSFRVSEAHFTNDSIQQKVDALSIRSQGKIGENKDSKPPQVSSEMTGTFDLANGLLTISQLQYEIPGTRFDLDGTYSLDGNQFDFHGKLRMDAKLSQMVTGWKSILLKPVDPFFNKNGAGTEIPVKISGTKSEPHFGLDFGHKEKGSAANPSQGAPK
jgi:hypothetical protein